LKKLGFVIVFLCLFLDLHSQNQPVYTVQSADPKLFGGKVNCIFQDKAGFLWIGKANGLFRFDGNEMKSYQNIASDPNSIGGNDILSIVEDEHGDLWIGTKGFGLDKFNRSAEKFTHFKHNAKNPNSISHNEVYTIKPDGSGNFWIGTDGGGLNYFQPKKGLFKSYQSNSTGLQSNNVLCITDGAKGKYWVGTFLGGLHTFDIKSRKFTHIGSGTPYANINIFAIKEVSKDILWLATWRQGLVSYNIKTNKFQDVISASIAPKFRDIKLTDKGEIWASANGFLFYFSSHKAPCQIVKTKNEFQDIWRLFIDRSKNIWLGSENGNLGKLNTITNRFSVIPSKYFFSNNFPYAVLADNPQRTIYFSSQKLMVEYNYKSKSYKSYASSFEDIVAMAMIPQENSILFASTFMLGTFDKVNGTFSKIIFDKKSQSILEGRQIKSITVADSSSFWLGTEPHAIKIGYSKNTKLWKVLEVVYSGKGKDINDCHSTLSFVKGRNGDLYIGTLGGGLSVRKAGQKGFKHFVHEDSNANSISNNDIVCMIENKSGEIVIGTNRGLNIYNPKTSSFRVYTAKDGLANDEITAISIDKKNRIWLSSQKGISILSNGQKEIRNYDFLDGLPSDNFLARSVATDESGNFYFGSRGGLVWFNPNDLTPNPILPTPRLVGFKINDKEVSISDSSPLEKSIENTDFIYLDHNQSSFSFKMAALNSYINPKKNRIKYKLAGYDDEWKMAGTDQSAVYSQIPSGNYTFSFMVSNEDGVWNTNVKNVEIKIGRAPWLSVWAFLIYFVILAGAVFYFYFISNRLKAIALLSQITPNKFKRIPNPELVNPSVIEVESADKQFIEKAIKIVEENISNSEFGVDQLCDKMFLGQRQLYRKINVITGLTVSEFIKEIRLKRAAQLILKKSGSVSEIAYQVGYNDPKYFSKCFKHQFGVSPMQYSNK
jgi:ligand-binding sensor domain-containing protein/AraC-like DNA-binding protein